MRRQSRSLPWRLALGCLLVAQSRWAGADFATFDIDSNDKTLVYNPSIWSKSDLPDVSKSESFKSSYLWAQCNTKQNCTLTIPFHASSVTLYISLIDQTNTSITIDGGAPKFVSDSWSLDHPFYGDPFFLKSFTPAGQHTLTLQLLDYRYSNGTTKPSRLVFERLGGTDDRKTTTSTITRYLPYVGPVIGIFVLSTIWGCWIRRRRAQANLRIINNNPFLGVRPMPAQEMQAPVQSAPVSNVFLNTAPAAGAGMGMGMGQQYTPPPTAPPVHAHGQDQYSSYSQYSQQPNQYSHQPQYPSSQDHFLRQQTPPEPGYGQGQGYAPPPPGPGPPFGYPSGPSQSQYKPSTPSLTSAPSFPSPAFGGQPTFPTPGGSSYAPTEVSSSSGGGSSAYNKSASGYQPSNSQPQAPYMVSNPEGNGSNTALPTHTGKGAPPVVLAHGTSSGSGSGSIPGGGAGAGAGTATAPGAHHASIDPADPDMMEPPPSYDFVAH